MNAVTLHGACAAYEAIASGGAFSKAGATGPFVVRITRPQATKASRAKPYRLLNSKMHLFAVYLLSRASHFHFMLSLTSITKEVQHCSRSFSLYLLLPQCAAGKALSAATLRTAESAGRRQVHPSTADLQNGRVMDMLREEIMSNQ